MTESAFSRCIAALLLTLGVLPVIADRPQAVAATPLPRATIADGTVADPRVLRSLGYGLDQEAITALKNSQFTPGTKDGQPVSVVATYQMQFKLTTSSGPAPFPGGR